jgi:RNA polymerase sigma-70 factor (ECF subfamily)
MSEVSAADMPDEGALVDAAQQGDRQAMNQLLARHWKTVDRLCRRMLRNALDAEDARQEALLQAARRISTFQGRSSFGTWIYAVTRHVCLNEIQKATRHPTTSFADQFDGSVAPVSSLRHDRMHVPRRPVSADDLGRATQRLDIDAAMREVSPAYHSVLVMWFFGDMTLADIAAQLDIPVNTVKTRLFKGKAQLAQLLGEPDDPMALSNRGSG